MCCGLSEIQCSNVEDYGTISNVGQAHTWNNYNAVMESDAFPTDDKLAAQLAEFLVGAMTPQLIEYHGFYSNWPLEQKALRRSLLLLSTVYCDCESTSTSVLVDIYRIRDGSR